jgi:hypothetical protein
MPETEEAVEAHWPPLTPEHGFPSQIMTQTQGAPPQLATKKTGDAFCGVSCKNP